MPLGRPKKSTEELYEQNMTCLQIEIEGLKAEVDRECNAPKNERSSFPVVLCLSNVTHKYLFLFIILQEISTNLTRFLDYLLIQREFLNSDILNSKLYCNPVQIVIFCEICFVCLQLGVGREMCHHI